jgi:hypothetical protein
MSDEKRAGPKASIPVSQVIVWIGTCAVAVAVGTFTLVRASTEAHVAALQAQLQEVRSQLAAVKPAAAAPSVEPSATVVLPTATIDAALGQKDLAPLAQRINDLEKERQALLQDLVRQSKGALEPSTELAALVSQLSSPDVALRRQAVLGLFDLRDKKSVPSLLAYLRAQPQEATDGPNPSIGEWFSLLWDLDPAAAAEFSVQQLESEDKYTSRWAYDYLRDSTLSREAIQRLQLPIKALALRSQSALARTRAKLLLESYAARLEGKQRGVDNRSLFDVVLDIEKDVKALKPSGKEQR